MNIDKLEAGRKLDALVAEAMGWTNCDPTQKSEFVEWSDEDRIVVCGIGELPDSKSKFGYHRRGPFPRYSTDIAVARAAITSVLDYLAQPGPRGGFRSGNVSLQKGAWIRHIHETDIHHGLWHCKFTQEYLGKQKRWWGSAGDLPLAICRAALKAMRPEGEK